MEGIPNEPQIVFAKMMLLKVSKFPLRHMVGFSLGTLPRTFKPCARRDVRTPSHLAWMKDKSMKVLHCSVNSINTLSHYNDQSNRLHQLDSGASNPTFRFMILWSLEPRDSAGCDLAIS